MQPNQSNRYFLTRTNGIISLMKPITIRSNQLQSAKTLQPHSPYTARGNNVVKRNSFSLRVRLWRPSPARKSGSIRRWRRRSSSMIPEWTKTIWRTKRNVFDHEVIATRHVLNSRCAGLHRLRPDFHGSVVTTSTLNRSHWFPRNGHHWNRLHVPAQVIRLVLIIRGNLCHTRCTSQVET